MLDKQTKDSLTVIKSNIDFGHSLGLQVTAEGVDDVRTLIPWDATWPKDSILRVPCQEKP
jgi:hypothetical protein